jgi:hypothetical protein
MPNNAERFGASIGNAQYKGEKKTMVLSAALYLFMQTLPIDQSWALAHFFEVRYPLPTQ